MRKTRQEMAEKDLLRASPIWPNCKGITKAYNTYLCAHSELMADPKTRKVIVLENPMLPTQVKQIIARTLFESLSIPSLSFASSPLCALLSIGRITGLVIDVGNLETSCLPVSAPPSASTSAELSTLLQIYTSRPLYGYLRTSPIASRHLRRHLRGLLKRYAAYLPHTAASTSSKASLSAPAKRALVSPIPDEVLTAELVEEVQTRACFVMPEAVADGLKATAQHRINADIPLPDSAEEELLVEEGYVQHLHGQLRRRYREKKGQYEEATDLTFRLPMGTMSVPGWLRHACTDTFFDSIEDVDAPSIPELILDTLLKVSRMYNKPGFTDFPYSCRSICERCSSRISCSSEAVACFPAFRSALPARYTRFSTARSGTPLYAV